MNEKLRVSVFKLHTYLNAHATHDAQRRPDRRQYRNQRLNHNLPNFLLLFHI